MDSKSNPKSEPSGSNKPKVVSTRPNKPNIDNKIPKNPKLSSTNTEEGGISKAPGVEKKSKSSIPTTNKAKDFRKYLSKGNVMKTLIKLLSEVYEEETPPKYIRDYVIKQLSDGKDLVEETYQEIRTKLRGIHTEILEIEDEIEQLREVIKVYTEQKSGKNQPLKQ